MSKNHIQYQDLPQTYKRKICYKYLCIFTYTDFLHFTNNVLRMATVSPLNQTLCSYFKFYFFLTHYSFILYNKKEDSPVFFFISSRQRRLYTFIVLNTAS